MCFIEREMAPERDIDDLPRNKANYTALTPLSFLERAATVFPNRKSLIHGSVEYTWHQTYRRCRLLASALTKNSVTFGSTVNFLLLLCFIEYLYRINRCMYVYLHFFIHIIVTPIS